MKFFVAFACLLAVAASAAIDDVAVVKSISEVLPESYNYAYELSNGVAANEAGALTGPEESIVAHGDFKYVSPEGENIALTYVADANGFQPSGAHLPVGPEIPILIQKALAYLEAHPYVEKL